MKIKLDENLPLHLATSLEDLGHDVHTTYSEGLTGHADRDMWRAAQAESRFLITQDLDFSDIRQFAPGISCGRSFGPSALAQPSESYQSCAVCLSD
jgi:hypothetical protein